VTDDYGVVVMCSAMGTESAIESAAVQHGYFTLALVEGLTGKADFNKDGVIHLNELDLYVTNRVKDLSKGRQHPVTARPASIRSFPLTRPGGAGGGSSGVRAPARQRGRLQGIVAQLSGFPMVRSAGNTGIWIIPHNSGP
jgi:hypothetical protein